MSSSSSLKSKTSAFDFILAAETDLGIVMNLIIDQHRQLVGDKGDVRPGTLQMVRAGRAYPFCKLHRTRI